MVQVETGTVHKSGRKDHVNGGCIAAIYSTALGQVCDSLTSRALFVPCYNDKRRSPEEIAALKKKPCKNRRGEPKFCLLKNTKYAPLESTKKHYLADVLGLDVVKKTFPQLFTDTASVPATVITATEGSNTSTISPIPSVNSHSSTHSSSQLSFTTDQMSQIQSYIDGTLDHSSLTGFSDTQAQQLQRMMAGRRPYQSGPSQGPPGLTQDQLLQQDHEAESRSREEKKNEKAARDLQANFEASTKRAAEEAVTPENILQGIQRVHVPKVYLCGVYTYMFACIPCRKMCLTYYFWLFPYAHIEEKADDTHCNCCLHQ